MAKKGAGKNRGNRKSKGDRKRLKKAEVPDDTEVSVEQDLRLVPTHVAALDSDQKDQAMGVLMGMGRDAAFQVFELAKEKDDEELNLLARRLSATPPQVDTNLYALRRASVQDLVEEAQSDAPLIVESAITVHGGAVTIFDPLCVVDDLVKSGRPRRDLARLEVGDLALFGMDKSQDHSVRFSTDPPPEGQSVLVQRLKVESGVVLVSVPEASDGPRLGTVRLDPFHTHADEHASNGGWGRIKSGMYRLSAYVDGEEVIQIFIAPDAKPSEKLLQSLADVTILPRPVDGAPRLG